MGTPEEGQVEEGYSRFDFSDLEQDETPRMLAESTTLHCCPSSEENLFPYISTVMPYHYAVQVCTHF